jgi:hypothetical protein
MVRVVFDCNNLFSQWICLDIDMAIEFEQLVGRIPCESQKKHYCLRKVRQIDRFPVIFLLKFYSANLFFELVKVLSAGRCQSFHEAVGPGELRQKNNN